MGTRFVNFLTLTYVEDRERIEHLSSLIMTGQYKVCWIIHDKDVLEDGTPDKPHCHAVIHLNNAMSKSAFSQNFAIRERFIQTCRKGDEIEDLDSAFLYMIHADKKSRGSGKFQYDSALIKGPMADYARARFKALLKKQKNSEQKEADSFLDILCFIESSLYVTMSDLSRWAAQNGHWSCFRRSSSIIRDVIKEHNSYLEKIQMQKDISKWQEDLERRADIESVYEAVGYRALKTLDLQLSRAGLPSLKLRKQINFIDDEISKHGGTKGGVNVALIREMLCSNVDIQSEAL